MRNTQQIGCFGFLALCLTIYFSWIAILYVGIPVAIVGGITSAYMFKSYPAHGGAYDRDKRFVAAVLAGGSAVLFCVSLAGNIFSADAPFSKDEKSGVSQPGDLANSQLIAICTEAVSARTDDQFGIGSRMNGEYDSSSVTPNVDGSVLVRLVRRMENAGQCPSKLIGSCIMRGERIIRKTDLQQQGYFAC